MPRLRQADAAPRQATFFILEPCKRNPARFATSCHLCRHAAVFEVLRSALVPSVYRLLALF